MYEVFLAVFLCPADLANSIASAWYLRSIFEHERVLERVYRWEGSGILRIPLSQ